MSGDVIHKAVPTAGLLLPNLTDYDAECAGFSWEHARSWLDGLPNGRLNIAHEAVDRWGHGVSGHIEALRLVHADETTTSYSYHQLSELTSRFANVLDSLGVGKDAVVAGLLGRRLEGYVSLLGTLKSGRVFTPLFAAYGPEPVRQRLEIAGAEVLVTTRAAYDRKVADLRHEMPHLRHVLLVDDDSSQPAGNVLSWHVLLDAASPAYITRATARDDPALLHFTSGTTGTPKGALHVHEAVVAHYATGRFALDLHPGDIYWCTADPGWVTGTSYGAIAPLSHGVTVIVDEEEFDPQRWWRILERQHVNVWYTAPTALRMLMRGADAETPRHLPNLRFAASVGEPLNPEIVTWGQRVLGQPVHDNWWQTETGGIMIANYAACDVRPGSMGRPLPGIDAAVVAQDPDGAPIIADGGPVLVFEPDRSGVLALRRGWPSMFRGYLHEEERYRACFSGNWYLTGDIVRRDADGWYWFVGRGDDVIKTAGHLVGPFEVESALMEHPAVGEAGVVGRPDAMAGEIVRAFVVLKPPYEPTAELQRELIGFARKRLGAAVAPRELEFADALPHTESGKIVRRALKDLP
ncbi:MAG TPA: acetate--CoA ligase [Mycobacteriales bacterium]|nr:acetate--CoA ligase [Mycobacteriales bacterium]